MVPSLRSGDTIPHTCAVSPTLPYVAFLFVAFALAVLSAARLACPRQIRRGGSVDLLIRKRRQVVYAPSQHRIARWLRRRGSFAAPPQMLRRKTRRSGRSGQGDAWKEQAQGNGETPVRVMRQRTQARQGGGIPPTKNRAADGGCSAREESSFSPEGATSMRRLGPAPEGAMRGHGRGRSRAEPFWARRIRQDHGPTAYMYTPSGRVDGEAARPERRARLPRPWPHAGRQTHRTASYPNRGRTMSGKPTHTMHGNVKPQSVRTRRRRRRETP